MTWPGDQDTRVNTHVKLMMEKSDLAGQWMRRQTRAISGAVESRGEPSQHG